MNVKLKTKYGVALLAVCVGMAASSGTAFAKKKAFKPLNEAEFAQANKMYFERCAGCHGVLRKGATGKNLEPKPNKAKKFKGTLKAGTKKLSKIISQGTEGGMNNFDDIFSKKQINLLARYIQMTPPIPPERSLAEMKESHKVFVQPKDYPTKPVHGRNWQNFFIAIERDKGSIAIIDGDKKEVMAHISTGYAVHVLKTVEHHETLKAKDAGRFWYVMGRDGMMTKIDLWADPKNMKVAQVQVAYDARDVAVSGDGKYVIGGGYWPPHFVIADAMTMEPLKVVSARGVNVDGEYVNESRVAAIYDTPKAPTWLVAMKELGQMWQVDYSDLDNLKITKIDSAKYLHDGFYDPTGRYFQIAANASNKMVVIDTVTQKLEAMIDVDKKPHPGPGANWNDDKCGPVSGTTHLGVGKVTVWGNDPKGHKDQAWKICYEVDTDGAGVFLRTHPKSKYVWIDQTKFPEPAVQQSVKVLDKKTRKIVKTIRLTTKKGYAAVHFEFNKDGTEVWASVWNRADSLEPNGEIIIFDAETLEEKARVKGLYAPTGKFNVYNRVNHVT